MVEKIKTDVYRLLLVSNLKKSSILANISENLFSLSKPEVVYLLFFFYKDNINQYYNKIITTVLKNNNNIKKKNK